MEAAAEAGTALRLLIGGPLPTSLDLTSTEEEEIWLVEFVTTTCEVLSEADSCMDVKNDEKLVCQNIRFWFLNEVKFVSKDMFLGK